MGKISKLLYGSLAVNSIQAQDFEVTSCDDPNLPVSEYMSHMEWLQLFILNSGRKAYIKHYVNFLDKTAELVLSVNQRYR